MKRQVVRRHLQLLLHAIPDHDSKYWVGYRQALEDLDYWVSAREDKLPDNGNVPLFLKPRCQDGTCSCGSVTILEGPPA